MRLDSGQPAIALRSDLEVAELGAIRVIGADKIATDLKGVNDGDKKRELIAAVLAGTPVHLEVTARTFRQKDGKPNRRGLRFEGPVLAAVAASYVGQPVLLDHNTYEQAARIGTIVASELYEQGDGWQGFRQTLRIVKPEAVISVLDGTLDRFSIGWLPTGPVLCSLHRTDVRSWASRCCYPLEEKEVDGKLTTIEWCFTSADGTEVSAVNVPAVKGTKIEDIRSALDAEISLGAAQVTPTPARSVMAFTRLAALLGITALAAPTDEDAAIAKVEGERRSRLAAEQERDAARTELTTVKAELATAKTSGQKAAVDAVLEGAYREGKLQYGRDSEGTATPSVYEPMLRKLAASEGLEALKKDVASLPVRVPLRQRPAELAKEPARDAGESELSDDEKRVCQELGITEDEFLATKKGG